MGIVDRVPVPAMRWLSKQQLRLFEREHRPVKVPFLTGFAAFLPTGTPQVEPPGKLSLALPEKDSGE